MRMATCPVVSGFLRRLVWFALLKTSQNKPVLLRSKKQNKNLI